MLLRRYRTALGRLARRNESTRVAIASTAPAAPWQGQDTGSLPDFDDYANAFRSKTIVSLLRSVLVLSLCQMPPLVNNAERLLKTSYRFLGRGITDALLRFSFYGHFCAGEGPSGRHSIQPVVGYLHRQGVGSILDYAAEGDAEEQGPAKDNDAKAGIQCRVYDYRDEELCDRRAQTFEACIRAVQQVSPTGFAAIKVTALGPPALLLRMSAAVSELRSLFGAFDSTGSGRVDLAQFTAAYVSFFDDGPEGAARLFARLDAAGEGTVDYVDWSNSIKIEELNSITGRCKERGPLARAALDEGEVLLLVAMRRRVEGLCALARDLGVRVMIDAEHCKFQPAIDNIANTLSRAFNLSQPVVFATYQLYLRDAPLRLRQDMDRAHKGGYAFACKVVRGAYMQHERQAAREQGLPDPVHASLEDTHAAYDAAVGAVVGAMAQGRRAEVMVATHNQASVEAALRVMRSSGMTPCSGVYFGQVRVRVSCREGSLLLLVIRVILAL